MAAAVLTLTYGFGLLAWQLYAWLHGFGYVAGLNLHYFASGMWFLVLGSLLLGLCGAMALITELTALWLAHARLPSESASARGSSAAVKVLRRLISAALNWLRWLLVLSCCVVGGLPLCVLLYLEADASASAVAVVAIVCALYFVVALLRDGRRPSGRQSGKAWLAEVCRSHGWALGLGALSSLALYCVWVYPALPQELGGGHPKTCYIDIEADKFSDDMVCELVCGGPPDEKDLTDDAHRRASCRRIVRDYYSMLGAARPTVLHSRELELWFDGADRIIVRVSGDVKPLTSARRGIGIAPQPQHMAAAYRTAKDSLSDQGGLEAAYRRKVVRIPQNLFLAVTIHERPYVAKLDEWARQRGLLRQGGRLPQTGESDHSVRRKVIRDSD